MKRGGMVHLGAALSGWLRRRKLKAPMRPYVLSERWTEIVGERIASRTRPSTLRDNGELVIAVANSAWLNELSFMRADLRRKINTALADDAVKAVRLVVGPIERPSPPPPRPSKKTKRFANVARAAGDASLDDIETAIERAMEAQRKRPPNP